MDQTIWQRAKGAVARGVWGHAPPGNFLSFRCSEIDSGAFWDTSARVRVHAWQGSITKNNFILSDYRKQQHRLQYSLRSSFSAARTSANSGTWLSLTLFHGAPCCVHDNRVSTARSQTFLSSKSLGTRFIILLFWHRT